jgi:DNA-binding MarR family transcriptional regulator
MCNYRVIFARLIIEHPQIMQFEKELKTRNFSNEFIKVALNIQYTSSILDYLTYSLLKPLDLTPQQYQILRILKESTVQPVTIKWLSLHMIDKNSNASRLVDKLVTKELAIRQEVEYDRRIVHVFLTEKGRERLHKAAETLENGLIKRVENISEDEAKTLNMLLDNLRG